MEYEMNPDNKNRIPFKQLLMIVLIALISMTAYEYVKYLVNPQMTIWQSHAVTILFSTIVAGIAAYYVLYTSGKRSQLLSREIDLREHTEEELRESENKFRSFAEQSIIGVYLIQDGLLQYVNPRFAQMFGYTVEECLNGMPFKDLVFEEDLTKVEEQVRRRIAGEVEFVHYTLRGLKKNGEIFYVEIYGSGTVYKGKQAATGTTFDITERKQAEEALHESEEKFRSLFNQAADLIAIIDLQGIFMDLNRKFEEEAGWSPVEMIGRNVLTSGIVTEESARKVSFYLSQLVQGKGIPIFEVDGVRKDGGIIPYEIRATPIRKDDKTVSIQAILRNITERKQAEKAQLESEERFRQIAVISEAWIWEIDDHGLYTYASPVVEKILGYKPEEIVGKKHFYDFFTPEMKEELREAALEVFKSRQVFSKFVNANIHKNGHIVILETSGAPILDDVGNLLGYRGADIDITERKKAEETLEKRLVALTRPLDDAEGITFGELFNLNDLQQLQDEFARATGVASLITRPDGTPITAPSNFCRLCNIIRKTDKGHANCFRSDAVLGRPSSEGPTIQPCMSGGLWDAGAVISVGGRHIANWLIGQVRDIAQSEDKIRAYAREIGSDETATVEAFREVPAMSREQFQQIAQMLFTLSKQLSATAYQNVQQARFITERKQFEEALRESHLFIEGIINSIPVRVFWKNSDLVYLGCNTIFARDAGFENPSDIIGKDDYQMGWSDQADLYRSDDRQVIESGQHKLLIEEPQTTPEGKTIYLLTSKIPLYSFDKKIIGVLGIYMDITEHKKFEDALRASEAELHDSYFTQATINMILRESLENIPLELILQKALNMILSVPWLSFASTGSIHLAEGEPGILSMKACYNLPKPLVTLCAHIPFGHCLCGKAAQTQDIEFADHVDDRHQISYEGMPDHGHYAVPILFRGKTLGVLNIYLKEGHIRDQKEEEFLLAVADTLVGIIVRKKAEEEQRKLEDQLLLAQKMEAIGVLAGGIAHDFNNLLQSIIMGTAIAKTRSHEDNVRDILMQVENECLKAEELSGLLITFSKGGTPVVQKSSIADMLKETVMPFLKGSPVTVAFAIPDDLFPVQIDEGQIRIAINHLVMNAKEAMPSGGMLKVQAHNLESIAKENVPLEEGKYVKVTFADNGPGISPENLSKIFDPYFTTKQMGSQKGTGLSLAVSQSIIKKHKGIITAESKVGTGSMFHIYLPAALP